MSISPHAALKLNGHRVTHSPALKERVHVRLLQSAVHVRNPRAPTTTSSDVAALTACACGADACCRGGGGGGGGVRRVRNIAAIAAEVITVHCAVHMCRRDRAPVLCPLR